jgi:uncharacterized protein (DUF3084 family)
MQIEIEEVQDIVDELEKVATTRIRSEAKLESAYETLGELGFTSTDNARKDMKKLDAKIEKRENALEEDFNDFMDDYQELFT